MISIMTDGARRAATLITNIEQRMAKVNACGCRSFIIMKLPRREHDKAVNTNGSFRRVIRNQLEQKFYNLVGVHGL